MGFPSLGQLCRRQAIANISQVTYIPEGLSLRSVMDILLCVTSSGILKTIQANSAHLLSDDQLQILWERFVVKEFPHLLQQERSLHDRIDEEHGTKSMFPSCSWEQMFDKLALKDFRNLKRQTAQAAVSMKMLNEEKAQKSTMIIDDPRKIIAAKPRGQPGTAARARTATQARGSMSAVRKITQQTRDLAAQRRHALASASPSPSVEVEKRRSIRKPVVSLKTARAKEQLLLQRQKSGERKAASASPPLAASSKMPASHVSKSSAKAARSTTPPTPIPSAATSQKLALTPAPTPATSGPAPKSSAKPAPPRRGLNLFGNNGYSFKGVKPSRAVQYVHNADGSWTTTTWTEWERDLYNRRILATYTPEKRAAALAEKPVVVTTKCHPKKRGADPISADASPGLAADATVRPMASSSPLAKKTKTTGGVFMPPRRH